MWEPLEALGALLEGSWRLLGNDVGLLEALEAKTFIFLFDFTRVWRAP